eukprot:ANDGO_01715.mRNA.1 hypothetical protein
MPSNSLQHVYSNGTAYGTTTMILGRPRSDAAYWAVMAINPFSLDLDDDGVTANDNSPLQTKICEVIVFAIESNPQNFSALRSYDTEIGRNENYMAVLHSPNSLEAPWPAEDIEDRLRCSVANEMERRRGYLKRLVSPDGVLYGENGRALHWKTMENEDISSADVDFSITVWFPPRFLHPLPSLQDVDPLSVFVHLLLNMHCLCQETPWEKRTKSASELLRIARLYEEKKGSNAESLFPASFPKFRLLTSIKGRPNPESRYWALFLVGPGSTGRIILIEASLHNGAVCKEYVDFFERNVLGGDSGFILTLIHEFGDTGEENTFGIDVLEYAAREIALQQYLEQKKGDYPIDDMVDDKRTRKQKGKDACWTRESIEDFIANDGDISELPLERMKKTITVSVVICNGYLEPCPSIAEHQKGARMTKFKHVMRNFGF